MAHLNDRIDGVVLLNFISGGGMQRSVCLCSVSITGRLLARQAFILDWLQHSMADIITVLTNNAIETYIEIYKTSIIFINIPTSYVSIGIQKIVEHIFKYWWHI